ncbi:unnamed protein product [Rotaria sordida]|uniref:Uncharacterized protein n=1 Tax=Rotaria sordida TaxID=392033 RepID=A0A815NE02_9BILA|nr:unnamed protein product [Rotaria sordida]
MSIEQDPYSLVKYINVINTNNDGYGEPTIHAFVEMGLLKMNDKLHCEINGRFYECYINKDEKDQYILCYQNRIQDTNVAKFIVKLSKLIKIKIQYMRDPFQRIQLINDDRTLRKLCYNLNRMFENRLTDILINSEFGIWRIETTYDFNKEKIKTFICASNMTYNDILQKINNDKDMNNTDIDNDRHKEKQQLYSLLRHDAIKINYEPMNDKDIFKLDKGGNDISYGSGIDKDEIVVQGTISLFVKNMNNNHHYALTAMHVIKDLDINLVQVKHNSDSFKNLSIDLDNIIELNCDAVLFKIKGSPYCKIANLDCTALSSHVYKKVLTSSESSSESSFESPNVSLLLDDSDSEEFKQILDKKSRNPLNVTILSLQSLLSRNEPTQVQ